MLLTPLRPYAFLAAAWFAAVSLCGHGQAIAPSTAIPVVLTRTIVAGEARPGDAVTAKTLQVVHLPGNRVLPAGARLVGRVTASTPFIFDRTPYAAQKSSALSIHFDSVVASGETIPVTLSVRAIASPVASHEAEIPHDLDELDWSGTRVLIGGDTFSPLERTVLSPDGRAIAGYHRSQGNFARLIAAPSVNPESNFSCDATPTEESIAVFSASACGVYGMDSAFIADSGRSDGTFVLQSLGRSVRLYAGATALLQVSAPQ